MTLEEIIHVVFSEYGLLVSILLTMNIVQWRRNVVLEDKLQVLIENNTTILTKLLERLKEHD